MKSSILRKFRIFLSAIQFVFSSIVYHFSFQGESLPRHESTERYKQTVQEEANEKNVKHKVYNRVKNLLLRCVDAHDMRNGMMHFDEFSPDGDLWWVEKRLVELRCHLQKTKQFFPAPDATRKKFRFFDLQRIPRCLLQTPSGSLHCHLLSKSFTASTAKCRAGLVISTFEKETIKWDYKRIITIVTLNFDKLISIVLVKAKSSSVGKKQRVRKKSHKLSHSGVNFWIYSQTRLFPEIPTALMCIFTHEEGYSL